MECRATTTVVTNLANHVLHRPSSEPIENEASTCSLRGKRRARKSELFGFAIEPR